MVYATIVITILSYLVWLHHFFTMGSGASVNSFFGITTMIISIPTGAKIFNWLFTMYRGRIRFEVPMMWTIAFMITFVIGGMTGVLLAVPPADFVRSEEHTSELQSLMRISYAVFCLKKKIQTTQYSLQSNLI